MLRFIEFNPREEILYGSATLVLEQRIKSRLKLTLDNGEEAGLFLPRGSILQHGDCLRAESGEVIEIRAAEESVSTLYTEDALLKARACYHLGNRHVPLQIEAKFVRYQHDHVLDDMLRQMGLTVVSEMAPFEPEPGAYHSHGGGHHHAH